MSVNQQTVEETKQQIRGLVNEIAALSKSGATAEEYYPELLQRIVTALAAPGGAVWLLDDDRSCGCSIRSMLSPRSCKMIMTMHSVISD